jgi:hypothetical protein
MFFAQSEAWAAVGARVMGDMAARFGGQGLLAGDIGLVLVAAGAAGPEGFEHCGKDVVYPCSLVKAFHLVHALAALEEGRVAAHGEMDRALRDMIRWSSNTATNYVIDLVTGTTGDTLLEGAEYLDWASKRERLNRFFWRLGWPEWEGANIAQKLMDDTRYGREARFAGDGGAHLNKLSPLGAARLMWELFEGEVPLSRPVRARAQAMLRRDPAGADAENPAYQLAEYLGGALPADAEIWSKAGHNLWTGDSATSWFKHDMIRMAGPGRRPLIVVLTTKGEAIAGRSPEIFPGIGRMIWDATADLCHV